MTSIEQSGEMPDVNVSGQGIQIGTGNNQYNAWMPKPPLDPAALGALNPHTAVARLQQLSHDDLVDFFARASPDDVSEILEVFLKADGTRVVAVLGDISRRKAAELIGTVRRGGGLAVLPEAAQEIARKAASFKWVDAGPLKLFYMDGYARRYSGGRVFWSPEFGARVAVGVIDDYVGNGYGTGFPAEDQEPAPTSPYGTEGIQQKFSYGMICSSKHGVFRVVQAELYEHEGGSGGWLGLPIGKAENGVSIGEAKDGTDLLVQNFEGGMIFARYKIWDDLESVFAVRREVADVLPDQGWRPVSRETTTVSSFGRQGTIQRFKVELESGTYETAVYWDEPDNGVVVVPEIWNYYSNLGAEKSWLGFPMRLGMPLSGVRRRQRFEGGTTYWKSGSDPIAVHKALDDYIFQDHDLLKRLGYPVAEEASLSTGETDRIQFFKGGVVTLRDGKYEVWVRPDSKPESPMEPDTMAIPRAVPRAIPRAVLPSTDNNP